MEIVHDTPFQAALYPILDKDGTEGRVAILKATYFIEPDGTVRIAEEQEPVYGADEFMGEPGKSSIRHASDGAYFKAATDIAVVGTAYAPKGRAVTAVPVSLSVGKVTKTVAVVGDRSWSYSVLRGARSSDPKPFSEMPLAWERAFGGTDTFDKNPKKHAWEKRNPIGTGFRVTSSVEALDGLRLPNFEDPAHLLRGWDGRPTPQGFGFIGQSWVPRIQYAGTYDEAWDKHRRPILPIDFDYQFFNSASPDLVYPGYLEGGEAVQAKNLSKAGLERFQLPRARVTFRGFAQRKRFEAKGRLDTVVFQFDKRIVSLVWRTKFAVLMNEPADAVHATVH